MMKNYKRPMALLAAVLVLFSALYLPGNVYTGFGFGIPVLAEESANENTPAEDGFGTLQVVNEPITPSQPTAGDGTEGNPYRIGTAGELYWFAAEVNGGNNSSYAVLTADITVNTAVLNANGTVNAGTFNEWTPIGDGTYHYNGRFDGQGYTVSGLYFNDTAVDYVGLFGYVGSAGDVFNVGVADSYLNGKDYVGGVCGRAYGGANISNCRNEGAVSGATYVGGICGHSYLGSITSCYNTGTVCGTTSVGGVDGYKIDGEILNCYNTGAVSGTTNVGGVC